MGSNKVIIDGCNVAECKKYHKGWCLLSKTAYGNVTEFCNENNYCEYKQLQRAKAENEELKKCVVAQLKLNVNHLKIINNFLHENNILKAENGTLQEFILQQEQIVREGIGCKYPSALELSIQLSRNTTIELEKQIEENEKLKERVKQLDEMTDIYSVRLMEKYKQALEEVREWLLKWQFNANIIKHTNEPLNKINEVLKHE